MAAAGSSHDVRQTLALAKPRARHQSAKKRGSQRGHPAKDEAVESDHRDLLSQAVVEFDQLDTGTDVQAFECGVPAVANAKENKAIMKHVSERLPVSLELQHTEPKRNELPTLFGQAGAESANIDKPTADPTLVHVAVEIQRLVLDGTTWEAHFVIDFIMDWKAQQEDHEQPPEKQWCPVAVMPEALALNDHEPQYQILDFGKDNREYSDASMMHARIRYAGSMGHELSFESFPFDLSWLVFTFQFKTSRDKLRQTKEDYRVLIERVIIGHRIESMLQDFDVKAVSVSFDDRRRWDEAIIKVCIVRNPRYCVYKIVLPLVTITLINSLAFCIPRDSIADILAFIGAMFLSVVGLLGAIGSDLPRGSTVFSALDKLILLTIGDIAATAVNCAIRAVWVDDDTYILGLFLLPHLIAALCLPESYKEFALLVPAIVISFLLGIRLQPGSLPASVEPDVLNFDDGNRSAWFEPVAFILHYSLFYLSATGFLLGRAWCATHSKLDDYARKGIMGEEAQADWRSKLKNCLQCLFRKPCSTTRTNVSSSKRNRRSLERIKAHGAFFEVKESHKEPPQHEWEWAKNKKYVQLRGNKLARTLRARSFFVKGEGCTCARCIPT